MKKILISGKNGYIGLALKNWLIGSENEYIVETICLRNPKWNEKNLSTFSTVCHFTGIAHRKETLENQNEYMEVNCNLAFEFAKKCKLSGVSHFIFMSSMSVYGITKGEINEKTPTIPKSFYGKSKLEAEKLILTLEDENFKVSIVRPPMVYGKMCKGNYTKLSALSKEIPFFPKVSNKRSMIYIDNLTEFFKKLIDIETNGIFFPQNTEYVNTSELVNLIAKANNKNIFFIPFKNILSYLNIDIINKIFGSLTYDMTMSNYDFKYQIVDFETSILNSEK